MKEKVVTYLKGLKKEQWIVYLLLGALLVVIAIPVKKKDSGKSTGSETDTEAVTPAADTAASQEEEMERRLELRLPGWREWVKYRLCCRWNLPIKRWWKRIFHLQRAVSPARVPMEAPQARQPARKKVPSTRRAATEVRRLCDSGDLSGGARCAGGGSGRR